jgi:molecular chaperone DnaK (HSP70)
MLNEPSAAGFEYTHRHRDTLTSRRDAVAVYDLGGGTFDASLVRMSGLHHEVVATAGIPRLGGDDFDVVLAEMTLARAGVDLSRLDARAERRVLDVCRMAKESLSTASRKVTVDLEAALGADAPLPEVTLAAADYYEACAPLVERTIEALKQLDLGEAAGIYVVGGASELPVVARALREHFGRRVHRSPHPAASVAIGLAIASDDASGFELVDRYSKTFGVFREAHGGGEIAFDPIFSPETELPDARGGFVERTRAYRAAHNVGHFRFFECSAFDDLGRPRGDMTLFEDVRFPFDMQLQGSRELAEVRIVRLDELGPHVVERYRLTQNGTVELIICDQDSGFEQRYVLGRS